MKITPKSGELVVDIEIPEGSYMLTDPEDKSIVPCFIDAFLANQMRPHQKEGVKFMFDCLVGFRGPDINGCILAVTNYLKLITSQDSMGLGKTLQTIGVIWTLLKKSNLAHQVLTSRSI
jgi:Superfamily II DNA/RNA helicases, SNF2 family